MLVNGKLMARGYSCACYTGWEGDRDNCYNIGAGSAVTVGTDVVSLSTAIVNLSTLFLIAGITMKAFTVVTTLCISARGIHITLIKRDVTLWTLIDIGTNTTISGSAFIANTVV